MGILSPTTLQYSTTSSSVNMLRSPPMKLRKARRNEANTKDKRTLNTKKIQSNQSNQSNEYNQYNQYNESSNIKQGSEDDYPVYHDVEHV